MTWEFFQNFALPISMLFTALITGARGDWIFGREAREKDRRIAWLEERLDRAEKIAERGLGTADRATRMAERREASDAP